MYFSQMKIWNRHPSSIEHSSESAKGVGVGTQIIMENGISSTLEYGYPFTNPVGNDSMKPQVGLNFNWKF
jgi:hemolysin activation/secretion protein